MFEHQITVLNGVKNNRILFKKELIKSLQWLDNSEVSRLIKWVKQHFYPQYADIINEVLNDPGNKLTAIHSSIK